MRSLRVLSLFAGVGGFDMAAQTVGMETAMACEINPQARAIFRYHFPETHIAHDIKRLRRKELNEHGPFDVVCGGFPCQDISIAGRRMGLAGARSGLFHRIMRLIPKLETRPRYVVLENVNGLLSSGDRRDMGTVLTELEKRGYWWAYRRLDLQFFGCPQRRQRIFIVGHLGDATSAAEVLFEPEGMRWHPAPRGGKRTGVAALTQNGVGICGADDNQAQAGHLIVHGSKINRDIAYPLKASFDKQDEIHETYISSPIPFDTTQITSAANFSAPQDGDPCHPLARGMHAPVIAIHPHCIGRKAEAGPQGKDYLDDGSAYTMDGRGVSQAVCFNARQDPNVSGDVAESLGAKDRGHAVGIGGGEVGFSLQANPSASGDKGDGVNTTLAIGFNGDQSEQTRSMGESIDQAPTLRSGGCVDVMIPMMQVRRLIPLECERLMGWPDDWTLYGIDDNGKEIKMSDSARYRMCGNGVGEPCARFILGRIQAVEQGAEVAA